MNTTEKIEVKEEIKQIEEVNIKKTDETPSIKIKKKKNTPKHYKRKPLYRNPNITDILYFD